MKSLFLAIALLISINASGQKNIYKAAFRYLKNKREGRELLVSDTVIHLDLYDFAEQLSSEWKKSRTATEKLLDSVDREQASYEQQCSELRNLHVNGDKPAKIIFFSNIYNNVFIAEIMDKKENRILSHYSQSMFNKSRQYLFILDNKNNIKKVFQAKYDVQDN